MKTKIIKIASNHNNVRTPTMEGDCADIPRVGEPFTITGKSLSFSGGIRVIETTQVKSIIKIRENYYEFKTLNSTYGLEIK